MQIPKTTKSQSKLIRILVFSNILEWYDIYSYAYFSPVLAKIFFGFSNHLYNLIAIFMVFGSAFLARFIGAFIFGCKGDLSGRKPAFIESITWVTITTFLIGCLPTYAQLGIWSPVLLFAFRIAQSISSAGEVPGTLCFLRENSSPENRKYMMSWTAVGNQIGSILGLLGSLLMSHFMSDSFVDSWGWRISFWIGALIGVFIIYIRNRLNETAEYISNKAKHVLTKVHLYHLIKKKRLNVLQGTGYGFINAASYYLIATYIPLGLVQVLNIEEYYNSFITLCILIVTTITLPIFGILAEYINARKLIIPAAFLMLFLLYPLYLSVQTENVLLFFISVTAFVILNSYLTAMLPLYLVNLFSGPMRYSGTGISFNLSDGIIGGFTPAISLLLFHYTGNPAAFCWFLAICSIISIISFLNIKEKHSL
jgi:MFS family permease